MYFVTTTVKCLCGKSHSPRIETDNKANIQRCEQYAVREAIEWKLGHERRCLGYKRLSRLRGII